MRRGAVVLSILLAALGVPALFVLLRYHGESSRTHETCLKDAIFCVQRGTRQAAEADDYDAILEAASALRTEATRLRALRDEFAALPEPSRWERSRMRKHRQLAESALESWIEIERDWRARLDAGAVPPHVRLLVLQALDEFAAARAEAWDVMMLSGN